MLSVRYSRQGLLAGVFGSLCVQRKLTTFSKMLKSLGVVSDGEGVLLE